MTRDVGWTGRRSRPSTRGFSSSTVLTGTALMVSSCPAGGGANPLVLGRRETHPSGLPALLDPGQKLVHGVLEQLDALHQQLLGDRLEVDARLLEGLQVIVGVVG